MVKGTASIKAGDIKHLGGRKFKVSMEVGVSDTNELLALTGTSFEFDFYDEQENPTTGQQERKPENGRLFMTNGNGVVEPVDPAPPKEPNGIFVCNKCGLEMGALDGEDTKCPECKEGTMEFCEVEPKAPKGCWVCNNCAHEEKDLPDAEAGAEVICSECNKGVMVHTFATVDQEENSEPEVLPVKGYWKCDTCGSTVDELLEKDNNCVLCDVRDQKGTMTFHPADEEISAGADEPDQETETDEESEPSEGEENAEQGND
jgi:DNA-directed RNA polymerase subunit RPC12/RpoP